MIKLSPYGRIQNALGAALRFCSIPRLIHLCDPLLCCNILSAACRNFEVFLYSDSVNIMNLDVNMVSYWVIGAFCEQVIATIGVKVISIYPHNELGMSVISHCGVHLKSIHT